MRTMLRAVSVVLALGSLAWGQQNPYLVNPYFPSTGGGWGWGSGGPAFGPGGRGYGAGQAMQGAASMTTAQGNVMLQAEQARIQREQAEQAKLDTKKQAFDLKMYEKANTPTFTQEQLKIKDSQLQRIMTMATPYEISQGQAQNIILPYLNTMMSQGTMGPPIPLSPDLLAQINVTSGTNPADIGPLKNGGKVDWPIVLRGPVTKELDNLLPQAVSGAVTGTLDFKLYRQVTNDVKKLTDGLTQMFRKEEIDGGEYLTGKRFLDSLTSAVNMLQQPDAGRFLSGSYAARGNNVPELVVSMSSQGLKFAPGGPGSSAAYQALYNSMVAYANATQASSGFQMRLGPQASASKN